MAIYLGLGANLGDKKRTIARAIEQLKDSGFSIQAVSPVFSSSPLLPNDASTDWYIPYVNCVVCCQSELTPEEGLVAIKQIEIALGRQPSKKWAPRLIDIDILIWNDITVSTQQLVIPHAEMLKRNFVLTPLSYLAPDLMIPGAGKNVLQLSQAVGVIPAWMAIVNVTPDSFSDGGSWFDEEKLLHHLKTLFEHGVQYIDIGAESTRPNATVVSLEQEWNRLKPVLETVHQLTNTHTMMPTISLDSRNWQTIQKALQYGIGVINDVSGLNDDNMLDLVLDSPSEVVVMHALTIPADPKVTLSTHVSPVTQLCEWLEQKLNQWQQKGLDMRRIIFDPGIGFGKNALQSYEVLQNISVFKRYGLRVLVGHSRKSFLNILTDAAFSDRDLETLGVSLALVNQGVDILRVHDALSHIRAYEAWSQIALNNTMN